MLVQCGGNLVDLLECHHRVGTRVACVLARRWRWLCAAQGAAGWARPTGRGSSCADLWAVVQRSRASNHPPLEQARGGRHCFSLNLDVQLYTKYSCICAVSTCRAEPEVRCIWV